MSKVSDALLAIQKEVANVRTNANNPHFQSTYADLGAILNLCRPLWTKQGLSVTQAANEAGTSLITTLSKEDEQQFYNYPLVSDKNTAQGMGSAVTYARRYSLKAIFGIDEVDDDGNDASPKPVPRDLGPKAPFPAKPKPSVVAAMTPSPGSYVADFGKFAGKTLEQITKPVAQGYADWLAETARIDKKPLAARAQVFIDEVRKAWPGEDPPPPLDDTDSIPF